MGMYAKLNPAPSKDIVGTAAAAGSLKTLAATLEAAGVTAVAFGRTAPIAGWLMIPHFRWVSYAAALDFKIWRLNS